jgi:3D (Asp-Asp-Asp) domain-containing protein
MKSIFGGSAIVAAALLSAFLFVTATPSAAETLFSPFQQSETQPIQIPSETVATESKAEMLAGKVVKISDEANLGISAPMSYVATAYSLRGRTASGRYVGHGIIAADPRVLPLGSRVRVEAGPWSGEYLVADTGARIKGRKIDIWTPSSREAMRFGRRTVKLTILSYGAKRSKKRVQI